MILITGFAGFIGSHLTRYYLSRGEKVLGIDNFNLYYDNTLKYARWNSLNELSTDKLHVENVDISNYVALELVIKQYKITKVCHLAAQAGVRYSIENPHAYIQSNIVGHLNMLEICRNYDIKDFVYASSSSVYGGNVAVPFSTSHSVDKPMSLYAATKRSDELMSYTYNHLYGLNTIGLRFFTVYGPYGRPDMATWIFTNKIVNDEPIEVYNNGDMWRDFTYIDDIITGVVSVMDSCEGCSVYNIGNNKPENLLHFISIIEDCLGKKANKILKPMQPGDVPKTWADITEMKAKFNYTPTTDIEEGIPKFIEWYKDYHG